MTLPVLAELAMDEAVILTREGQPVVAGKNVSGSDWESTSLANNPRFRAIVEAFRRSYQEKVASDSTSYGET
jgi:hypothetical protein